MKLTILIHCPDQTGIINAVTHFLLEKGGNVIYLDQHVDKEAEVFFMRLEVEFPVDFSKTDFELTFDMKLAASYRMQWSCHNEEVRPKMAVFVSKYHHCLYDLLSRYRSQELEVEIPFILSNHRDLEHVA
ncbi:MAG: ACT domain-containing protein, partial [Bacteroidota bacterium]